MTLTKNEQMVLLIDATMDELVVHLADVQKISPAIYINMRDKCADQLADDLDPGIKFTARGLAHIMDKRVADVIRGYS